MNQFHNTNVVFRYPAELKDKMRALVEAKNQQLFTFVRLACLEVLRREAPSYIPPVGLRKETEI